ncbi:hypothetical protein CMV37_12310, partial [Bacillus cereus]
NMLGSFFIFLLYIPSSMNSPLYFKEKKSRILYVRKKRNLTEKIENFKGQKFVSLLTNFY